MKQNLNQTKAKFGKLAASTLAAVYLLILVGGIVRSTGSGMGCPDWPTCFDRVVPPTSAEQLPADYQEIYKEKRLAKNERFAKLLSFFGADELAYAVKHDDIVGEEQAFNPLKTWIEYINRLVGVVIGLLILSTAVFSLKFWNVDRIIPALAIATLVIVIFQGWLGSIVVSTNLLPWMVTIHMLPALLIVALLIILYLRVKEIKIAVLAAVRLSKEQMLLITLLILSLIQVVIGTQVREEVDTVALANNYQDRASWIEELGIVFYIHRSYSILLVLLHAFLSWQLFRKLGSAHRLTRISLFLFAVVGIEILSGIIMAYFAIPAFLQPMHLLFGTALFGIQFYLLKLSTRSVPLPQEKNLSYQQC